MTALSPNLIAWGIAGGFAFVVTVMFYVALCAPEMPWEREYVSVCCGYPVDETERCTNPKCYEHNGVEVMA